MIHQLNHICESVSTIAKHHRRLAREKGEDFNVFSVLKMERKENDTHSAFLGALLHPKGSHYLGDTFLQLFINMVLGETTGDNLNTKLLAFQSKTANLKLEEVLGVTTFCAKDGKILKKCLNTCTCSGGRIDIYLRDAQGNTISIENKIDASDQNAQIKRYYNHNTPKNTVVYLTKDGCDPSAASKRNLIEGEHFFNISYKTHIVNWLEACLKETVNQPILRETIKQYILLIKKITNTVTNQEEQDLRDVLFKNDNLKAAKAIADNYETILNKTKEKFRKQVLAQLETPLLEKGFTISKGSTNYTNKFVQLWIKPTANLHSKQFYGIESFTGNGHLGGDLFIGVYDINKKGLPLIENSEKFNNNWPVIRRIKCEDDVFFNLSEPQTLKLIHQDHVDGTTIQSEKVVKEVLQFIDDTLNTHVIPEIM